MFSSRVSHVEGRNRIARALDARRAARLPIIDLTLSNPTRAGFWYPPGLLQPLAQERALCYDPQPFGLPSARQAVADDFARRGVRVSPERVVLTASTSEAYSLLFKLLCDPGDVVLAPRPSYPLIEHLTALDGVSLRHYSLEFHEEWKIRFDSLQDLLVDHGRGRVRAVVLISPNNPTGSVLDRREFDVLISLAREHELALIADEVFADYLLSPGECPSVLETDSVLTFALGGLSKSVGLPQIKLGWMGIGGPDETVSEAMERLETICDAYLSVSTPAQVAVPELLKTGAHVRAQILRRVRSNFAALVDIAAGYPSCSVLPAEAGWYAVVQVPAIESEESLTLDLLARTGILVHPGYFFDFEREAFLVMSLLPETPSFVSALQTLFHEIGQR
jgi:aspartate/methionine/tyrosine aminotransferase